MENSLDTNVSLEITANFARTRIEKKIPAYHGMDAVQASS